MQTTGNILVSQTGSAIPTLDPSLQGFMRWQHQTTPQSSTFVTGTNSFVQRNDIGNFQYTQGFLTGIDGRASDTAAPRSPPITAARTSILPRRAA